MILAAFSRIFLSLEIAIAFKTSSFHYLLTAKKESSLIITAAAAAVVTSRFLRLCTS